MIFGDIVTEWTGPPMRRRNSDGYTEYLPGSHFKICYEGNPRGYFDDEGCVGVSINSLGYRDTEHPPHAPAGTERIVFLGDSFTLGEGVRDEDIYPRLLAKQAGHRLEIINLGMSGDETWLELKRYREIARAMHPKRVILQWNTNDIPKTGLLEAQDRLIGVHYRELFQQAPPVGSLGRYLWMRWKLRSISNELLSLAETETASGELGFEKILELKRAVERDGAKFQLVIFPELIRFDHYPYASLIARLLDFCREHGIPVVNLLPALSKHRDSDLWVHETDHHPNELAHRIAAEEIARVLALE
jgi:lysophospholipase L1-like esterase